MNPSSKTSYTSNFGQNTQILRITPGRDCRLWPYIQAPDCSKTIYQCKSKLIHGDISPKVYQGLNVGFDYDLAGTVPCNNTVENYQYSQYIPSPCVKCSDSVNVHGTCRCSSDGTCGYMP